MPITGTQLIYRLTNTIRILIDYRTGGVDSFNIYWCSTSGGAYTLFANVPNVANKTNPAIRGKIYFEFAPSSIVGWNNAITNYIKIEPIIAGMPQPKEGPMIVQAKSTDTMSIDRSTVIKGYNTDEDRFIPVAVDVNGKVKVV